MQFKKINKHPSRCYIWNRTPNNKLYNTRTITFAVSVYPTVNSARMYFRTSNSIEDLIYQLKQKWFHQIEDEICWYIQYTIFSTKKFEHCSTLLINFNRAHHEYHIHMTSTTFYFSLSLSLSLSAGFVYNGQ